MDLALVILVVVLSLIIFALARANLMLIIVMGSMTTLTGFGIMANDGLADWSTFWSFGLCVAALLVGYLLFSNRRDRQNSATPGFERISLNKPNRASDGAVMGIVFVASVLAMYHLLAGGIPLFSDAIEVERFDFTSSGFFGIPGRMYLYGVPLAWAFTTAVAHFKGVAWTKYKPWVWATISYIVISLLSGFKSGLSGTLMLMLIFGIAVSGKRLLLRQLVFRYWWALLLPLVYGLIVAASYNTYQSSALPVWLQLVDRVTLVGAQPKQLAIEHQVFGAQPGAVWSDFAYFLKKYSGGETFGLYSFERAVSAQIIGVNPASSAWTTPVTVGGIPEFIFSFGTPLSIALFFLIGCLIRSLHRPAANAYHAVINCVIIYILYSWLTKGGFAYYTLNILAVALILTLTYVFLSAVLSGLHKDSVRPQRPRRSHVAGSRRQGKTASRPSLRSIS